MVQGGCDIAHEAHEEEGNLKDIVGDEVQPSHKLVIPCGGLEIDKKRKSP